VAVRYIKQIACYVKPEKHTALKALSDRTRVPMQTYMREAIDDLLAKYNVKVPKERKK
jgi:predicted DNA-binding protein